MKRIGNLYSDICDIYNIMDMYDNSVRKNTKNKKKIEEFNNFYSCNIKEIKEELITNNYTPDKYNIFLIREPKLRIIMSQSIKDKIVNHLVAKYFLVDVFDKTFINNNCATRCGKGTHYGLKLFKNYLNYYKNKYHKFYILKFDISKYFYNIDHEITKQLISNKIKDKKALKIIFDIIDSTDCDYINKRILELKEEEKKRINSLNIKDKDIKLKEIDNLPLYKKGKGCPIGNMTSQIVATLYLDEIDKYIQEKLKIKHYIRYCDDGVLFNSDKEYLKYCIKEIEKLLNKYRLKLNKKTKIYSSIEEIEFLGFRFILKNKIIMKVTNKTKKRFKKRINKKNISSYIGHISYGNCNNLIKKVIAKL